MKTFLKSTLMCSAILAILSPTTAFAETAFPRIEAVIPFELHNDYAYESDAAASELNNTFAVIEPEITMHFSEEISVVAGLVFENVNGPVGDRFFEDQGLFIEQLFAQYSGDNFNIKAGKFNPAFGIAWDIAPGIYGVDFAEDYELSEKIGFGADITFGDDASGQHILSAATFFADTSFLAQTFINSRGQPRIGDGGAGNTEDFSSFSVSLDSENVPALGGLGYTLGVSRQAAGKGDFGNETGYVVGLFRTFDISEDASVQAIVEWAHHEHSAGRNLQSNHVTIGGVLNHGPWNLAASMTDRVFDPNASGSAEIDDQLVQLSGGYAFENGLTADLGYRFSEEASVDTHIIGLLFTYELEVSTH